MPQVQWMPPLPPHCRTPPHGRRRSQRAKVASSRTIINFCEFGGNHTDPNPPNRGKGKNKHLRQGGRGRGGVAQFYNRSTDNPDCFFFLMGANVFTIKQEASARKSTKGSPKPSPAPSLKP
eukprot:scaffold4498_cov119-Isochrysis_galbana.AAC.45